MKIQTSLCCCLLFSANCHAQDDLFDDPNSLDGIQTVLSATRLITSQRDAPASVSIITADDIARYRFRNVPEALKTIPGFFVGESHISYDYYLIGYHGGNENVPRRTNVVIDGVSYYESGLSRVHWEKLPVVMSEIETIEVIRGPAASLYGSNSFTSTINIVTKNPTQTLGQLNSKGVSLDARIGQSGVRDISLSYSSTFKDIAYRVNVSQIHDDGFDRTLNGDIRRDSKWINNASVKAHYSLSETETLHVDVSHTHQNQQEQFIVSFQTSFPDYKHRSTTGAVKYENDISDDHNIQIKSYFRLFSQEQSFDAAVPALLTSPELEKLYILNSDYANAILAGQNPIGLGGGTAADLQAMLTLQQIGALGPQAFNLINLTVPQNFTDDSYNIEVQDTFVISDKLRLLSGGSIDYVDTSSNNWVINGTRDLTTYRLFVNAEYRPSSHLLVNAGTMYEYDKESGSAFSPRLTLAYHLTDRHTLRAVYSEANRPPDIFEQFVDWRLIGENFSDNPWGQGLDYLTFYARSISPGNLRSEKIVSSELGYLYIDPFSKVELDVRLFNEELTSLISEKLELLDFNPTNNGYATKRGLDIQYKLALTDAFSLQGAYSYLDIDSVDTEKSISVRHTTSMGVAYQLDPAISLSLMYYGLSATLEDKTSRTSDDIVGKPLDSLDVTLQWSPTMARFGQFSVYLQTRFRNGNQELQVDNLYSDRAKTSIGISMSL
jgi:iron complex outermembrane receptor protein